MSATADTAAGLTALTDFLKTTLGFEAMFVPEYAEDDGVAVIIKTMDATQGTIAAKQQAAATALYADIAAAGYGAQVTATQCSACAVAVINAVLTERSAASA